MLDAHADSRAWLASLIERGGFRPLVAAAEDDGYSVPADADIVLWVDDSGVSSLERLRQLCLPDPQRWAPVLFIASGPQESTLLAALEAGADDFLVKPFSPAMLYAKLRALIRSIVWQRELDELRRRSEAIAENIVDGIVVINEEGIIQSCNGAALRIFGYTRAELIGQNVSQLMPEPYRSTHQDFIRAYVAGRPARIIGVGQRQLPGKRKSGETFPLELGVSETRVDGRRYFLGILRDVSARVEAETKLRENARRLQEYHDAQEEENALGRDIIRRQMRIDAIEDPHLHTWLNPACGFSGDMLCVNRGPNDTLYALIADATGHGLAAAITGLPLLTLFHRMAQRGEALARMVVEINNELCATLPANRFVAACLVRIERMCGTVQLWSGGMPDALLLDRDGRVRARFRSRALPLGVVPVREAEVELQNIDIQPGEQIVLHSDGLTDARASEGDSFGAARLEAALRTAPASERLAAVQHAFFRFMQGQDAQDDVSLLLIDCARA